MLLALLYGPGGAADRAPRQDAVRGSGPGNAVGHVRGVGAAAQRAVGPDEVHRRPGIARPRTGEGQSGLVGGTAVVDRDGARRGQRQRPDRFGFRPIAIEAGQGERAERDGRGIGQAIHHRAAAVVQSERAAGSEVGADGVRECRCAAQGQRAGVHRGGAGESRVAGQGLRAAAGLDQLDARGARDHAVERGVAGGAGNDQGRGARGAADDTPCGAAAGERADGEIEGVQVERIAGEIGQVQVALDRGGVEWVLEGEGARSRADLQVAGAEHGRGGVTEDQVGPGPLKCQGIGPAAEPAADGEGIGGGVVGERAVGAPGQPAEEGGHAERRRDIRAERHLVAERQRTGVGGRGAEGGRPVQRDGVGDPAGGGGIGGDGPAGQGERAAADRPGSHGVPVGRPGDSLPRPVAVIGQTERAAVECHAAGKPVVKTAGGGAAEGHRTAVDGHPAGAADQGSDRHRTRAGVDGHTAVERQRPGLERVGARERIERDVVGGDAGGGQRDGPAGPADAETGAVGSGIAPGRVGGASPPVRRRGVPVAGTVLRVRRRGRVIVPGQARRVGTEAKGQSQGQAARQSREPTAAHGEGRHHGR